MASPALTESHIRAHASADSFARGLSYAQRGAVGPLVLRGELLHGRVAGSEYEPYLVIVTLDASGVRAATCTCLYDHGGWCKHIVALLLVYASAAPGVVEVQPALATLLAGLDRGQLAALLLQLTAQDPELAERIDVLLAATSQPKTSATGSARSAIDVAQVRQQIRRTFRSTRPDDHTAYMGIMTKLEPFVAQVQALLAADAARDALPLLEVLTDEYSAGWIDYYDSDGALGQFFDTLGDLWAEALLGANPKQAELRQWRERLVEWNAAIDDYGCEGFGIALQAAEEGWSEPWVDGAILGEALPGTKPAAPYTDDLLPIRLRILERSGHDREALNLAAAAEMHREHALLLVRLGQVSAALELGQAQFSGAAEALALAQALHDRGDLAQALVIGEHGLSLGGDAGDYGQQYARATLATWLVDPAADQGRIELALRAGAAAIAITPQLGLYTRLAVLADAEWPTFQDQLLTVLRADTGWPVSGRLDIFLHEGLIDDAIAALGTHPNGADLARVMDAALATHPGWVITAAIGSAGAIIDAGAAQHYAAAVAWLQRARAAYQVAGRLTEWQGYLQQLRTVHRRKHKLMGMLGQLERP